MTLSAATLALAIPVASKVTSAAVGFVGRTLSFQQLFTAEETAASPSSSDQPSLGQQLDSLSQSLRQWLADQGITTPYEIRVGTFRSDSSSALTVQGVQADEIHSLLEKDPDRLSALQRLAASVQALSSSLGGGKSGITISDTDSDIIY